MPPMKIFSRAFSMSYHDSADAALEELQQYLEESVEDKCPNADISCSVSMKDVDLTCEKVKYYVYCSKVFLVSILDLGDIG